MRPYPLMDEIKMHLFVWASDDAWKKLPAGLKDSLVTAMNEIKTREALKSQGMLDEREEATPASEKRKFIAIYRQKYLEYTDFECEETIGATENFIIQNLCNKLVQEGTNALEYLNWFYDEFLKEEFNKKRYGSPPKIKSVVSNDIYAKFLFEKKQSLKARKQDVMNLTVKSVVLELATSYVQSSRDKEFARKLEDFLEGRISLQKFSLVFHERLKEMGETELMTKLKGLISDGQL